MNVLAVDLEPTILSQLRSDELSVDTGVIVSTDDLERWLGVGIYNACVVVLGRNGFGFNVARTLRSRGINTPLIGVVTNFTKKSWVEYRAAFLEQGGNDLLRDPSHKELSASLQVNLNARKGYMFRSQNNIF